MDLIDRILLLQKAEKNKEVQQICLELCRRDPVYWFNTFCWTTNPRKDGRDLPFILYPYQEWCIREWTECIDQQIDFGIEKSRDMGATWMLMLLLQWGWLFKPGWSFHVGSRKEAEVCNAIVDPDSTLFGKFRYNLQMLPRWMRPKYHDKKLTILNEDNNNILTGESANPGFGRSRRYRAILFDELAFWENAEPAYDGCADTTNCRIVISTPYGESNKYYQIMHQATNELRVYPGTEQCLIEKGLTAA